MRCACPSLSLPPKRAIPLHKRPDKLPVPLSIMSLAHTISSHYAQHNINGIIIPDIVFFVHSTSVYSNPMSTLSKSSSAPFRTRPIRALSYRGIGGQCHVPFQSEIAKLLSKRNARVFERSGIRFELSGGAITKITSPSMKKNVSVVRGCRSIFVTVVPPLKPLSQSGSPFVFSTDVIISSETLLILQ